MQAPKPDANGKLNNAELLNYILESGMHPIFARALISDLDRNKDGKIDENEWKQSSLCKSGIDKTAGEEKLTALFKTLDKDGSGYLDYNDFKNLEPEGSIDGVSTSKLVSCIKEQLEKMDKDKDGKVSLKEFLSAAC